jgi:glycosyltransferase involved in cell wall biosynthesis
LIRNPTDDRALADFGADAAPWPAAEGEIRIVYTGQIYDAHFDAFRHLLAAIEAPDLQDVRLHVYSAQAADQLARGGIHGRLQLHPHQPQPAIYEVQRRADILFLPLAFDSPYPEIIRTSATTKLADYLASGRPLLVHAPAGSFPCWFAERVHCGLVVDQPSPDQLAAAIRHIRDDPALRQEFGANARACAAAEFTVAVARARLIELLERAVRG